MTMNLYFYAVKFKRKLVRKMGELLSINDLSNSLWASGHQIRKWILHLDLPAFRRKVGDRTYLFVDSEDFWKWGKDHVTLIKPETITPNSIPNEPEWVRQYRTKTLHEDSQYSRMNARKRKI
ncbi:hypothetical protein [Bacillus massiliglaciei]|uniref:hypothetical protein n=1 Tax=Bacillus massiliglaciei TaxID=1816693 RepID=UPI0018FEDE24|nr:hypothetical protein [Bacillus massiliglaciei]